MRDLFKKDITVKIMSVLIAIIFWLFVYNTSNPFTDRTFSVPLKIENQDYLEINGYKVKNINTSNVDIIVRGRKEVLDKIKASDFKVSMDMSQVKSVYDRKLQITPPELDQKDVKIVSFNPTAIDVILVRNKSASIPVELQSNITMKPGYVLLKTTLSQDTMLFNLEESVIDSIDKVIANLEIKNLDRDMTTEVQCKVYNKDGKEIPELSSGLNKVTVTIEVAKEVPVSLVTRGRLTADYVETLRVIEPVKVLLTGPADTLAKISEIKTEPVDIDKIDRNFSGTIPLVVPEGVKLVNTPKEITVNINVEKLVTRNIEVAQDDISILNANNDGSLTYEIKTEKLTLQIKGRQDDVNAVRKESMKPAVDVAGLGEGTHKLTLSVSLPQQVKLLQQHNVEVIITKTQPVDNPEDNEKPNTAF